MKKIKEFENYVISENADIINTRTGRVLKQGKNQKGYNMITLSSNGISKIKCVHRIMYESYVGNIPNGLEVNHMDGNKGNNSIKNLALITHTENIQHAVNNGLIKSGEKSALSKPVVKINCMTQEIICSYGSARIAEKETGVASSAISKVCNGIRKTAGGYIWKFKD